MAKKASASKTAKKTAAKAKKPAAPKTTEPKVEAGSPTGNQ